MALVPYTMLEILDLTLLNLDTKQCLGKFPGLWFLGLLLKPEVDKLIKSSDIFPESPLMQAIQPSQGVESPSETGTPS